MDKQRVILMKTRMVALLGAVALVSACTSTYKVREVQTMAPHGDKILVTYSETEYEQELFGSGLILEEPKNARQRVASCKQAAQALDCTSVKIDIDGMPLVYKKGTEPKAPAKPNKPKEKKKVDVKPAAKLKPKAKAPAAKKPAEKVKTPDAKTPADKATDTKVKVSSANNKVKVWM